MEVLLVKYSDTGRSHNYKIKTEIFKKEGKKIVSKTPLNKESKRHILNIHKNRGKLEKAGFKLNLVNSWMEGEKVFFDYVEGETLDLVLINLYFSRGKESFLNKLKEIKKIVEESWSPTISNLDMILDNMIQTKDGEITVIDYEWIYEGEIEKDFIFFRLLEIFYDKYRPYFTHKITFEEIIKIFFNDEILKRLYILNEQFYLEKTSNKKIFKTKKIFRIENLNYLQIFYDNGKGFNEWDSVKYYFDYLNEIDIKIPINRDLTSLRIDPKNSALKMRIEKRIFKGIDNSEIKVSIVSNAENVNGEIYEFLSSDPQMYFNNLSRGVLNISFSEIKE